MQLYVYGWAVEYGSAADSGGRQMSPQHREDDRMPARYNQYLSTHIRKYGDVFYARVGDVI